MASFYTGYDAVGGKQRYWDSEANKYSFVDTVPDQKTLDAGKNLTYVGQSPVTGLHEYKDPESGNSMFTQQKLPETVDQVNYDGKTKVEFITSSDGLASSTTTATKEEVKAEVAATPGTEGEKSSSADFSQMDAAPEPSATDVASPGTKATEINKSLGGSAKQSVATGSNQSQVVKGKQTTIDFMVQLKSKQTNDKVIFTVTPTLDESRAANYEHLAPVHHPGTIQVYKSTEARQFNISAKLIARTSAEASINLTYMNILRAWLMPYYGQGTAASKDKERLGGPPDIVLLSAYGDKNISSIPCVITSYHWVYPENVDYIPSTEGIPVPAVMDISLSLIESYSPEEYTSFDITKYRQGDMVGAYSFGQTPSTADTKETSVQKEAAKTTGSIMTGSGPGMPSLPGVPSISGMTGLSVPSMPSIPGLSGSGLPSIPGMSGLSIPSPSIPAIPSLPSVSSIGDSINDLGTFTEKDLVYA